MFIKLLQQAESNSQADEILALAQENGYSDQAAIYNAKMSYHLFRKDLPLLLETKNIMNRNEAIPDYTTYCLTIKAYCNADQIKKALECFAELQASPLGSVHIDANAYHPFVEYYVFRKDAKEAVSVYEAMKEKGVRPSQDIYAQLLNAAAPGGVASLNSVITQMQEADKAPLQETVLSHYMDIALGMNEIAAAESMLEKGFEESKLLPRLPTLTRLTTVYAGRKMEDKIFSLFQKITKIGYIPDTKFCRLILSIFRRKEHYKHVVQIHDYTKAKSIPLNQECYTDLIKNYAAVGATQQMTITYKEMMSLFPITTAVYSALLKGYALSDMLDDAETIRKVCAEEKLQLSFPSYVALVEAYYRRHNPAQAKQVLLELTNAHVATRKVDIAELWDKHNKMYELR